MNLTKTKAESYSRKVWQNGRTTDSYSLGRAVSEGAVLSVNKSDLKMPSSYQLAWVVKINGKVIAITDKLNRNYKI